MPHISHISATRSRLVAAPGSVAVGTMGAAVEVGLAVAAVTGAGFGATIAVGSGAAGGCKASVTAACGTTSGFFRTLAATNPPTTATVTTQTPMIFRAFVARVACNSEGGVSIESGIIKNLRLDALQ